MKLFYPFLLGTLILFSQACNQNKGVSVKEKAYEKLSDYGFFTGNLKELRPAEGVLPYDLNTPLFSDYAEKARFVWMPEGQAAAYVEKEVLDFPEGAVLIKNFYYHKDQTKAAAAKQIIETRLLINRAKGWEAMTYVWNEDQTEATLNLVGGITPLEWTNEEGNKMQVNYVIPNRNQCKGCHSHENKLLPIGPKVRNLNKSFAYSEGNMNQLEKWMQAGYLSGFDAKKEHARVANWEDAEKYSLHERAMAYLDINCGHCHNPNGPAATSGLNLYAFQEKNINLGIGKAPVSAAKGSGNRLYSIVPGKPDESILLYRMENTDPGAMMPEIGRTLVHEEGVALIREWIAEMEE